MRRPDTAGAITWPQLAVLCGIGTLVGTVIGMPTILLTSFCGTPLIDVLVLAPFILLWTLAGALVFSAVAAVIGAIPILLLRRHQPEAPLVTWLFGGFIVCGLVGAAHPLVLLFATIDRLASGLDWSTLSVAWMTGASGAMSGLLFCWWYKTKVVGLRPNLGAGVVAGTSAG
jgi:hypothetical protein